MNSVEIVNFDVEIEKSEKPVLHYSGGKDSTAVLFKLKDYWDKLTVMYVNGGDAFPETLRVMEEVRKLPVTFLEIVTDVETVREDQGWPSDIIGRDNTIAGQYFFRKNKPRLQEGLSCCLLALFMPLHKATIDGGYDLILRGTKINDIARNDLGDKIFDVNVWYPVKDMTDDQVIEYIVKWYPKYPKLVEAVLEPYTFGCNSNHNCMHCTAWYEQHENKEVVLKEKYPEVWKVVHERFKLIEESVLPHALRLGKLVG